MWETLHSYRMYVHIGLTYCTCICPPAVIHICTRLTMHFFSAWTKKQRKIYCLTYKSIYKQQGTCQCRVCLQTHTNIHNNNPIFRKQGAMPSHGLGLLLASGLPGSLSFSPLFLSLPSLSLSLSLFHTRSLLSPCLVVSLLYSLLILCFSFKLFTRLVIYSYLLGFKNCFLLFLFISYLALVFVSLFLSLPPICIFVLSSFPSVSSTLCLLVPLS
jgi:hypothetical protein